MASGVSRTLTVAPRVLACAGAVLVVGWAADVAWDVLSDPQISGGLALAILTATAVVPGLIGLCVIGVLWPIVSADGQTDPVGADQRVPVAGGQQMAEPLRSTG
jgi:hypothetical protein